MAVGYTLIGVTHPGRTSRCMNVACKDSDGHTNHWKLRLEGIRSSIREEGFCEFLRSLRIVVDRSEHLVPDSKNLRKLPKLRQKKKSHFTMRATAIQIYNSDAMRRY